MVALAVVLAVAAGFAVQHYWTGRPEAVPVPVPDVLPDAARDADDQDTGAEPSPAAGTAPAPTGGAATGGGDAGGARIVVDISGKVRSPGIHRLPAGSRVEDALRAAGGIRRGADTAGLNRARLLMDGEQVVVGAPAAGSGPAAAGSSTGAAPAASGAAGDAGGTAAAGPIGLNTATPEQLETLPGVGPVLAQHIIDYRTEHGGFRAVDELREVNGIGDRRFADLQNLVRP